MLAITSVQQVDALLDELEKAAGSTISTRGLLLRVLEALRELTEARGTGIFMPTQKGLLWLGQSGDLDAATATSLSAAWFSLDQTTHRRAQQTGAQPSWFAVPLRAGHTAAGGLVIQFSAAPSASSRESLWEILAAFAEIVALRQLSEREQFLDTHWERLQTTCRRLAACGDLQHTATLLVNELLLVTRASRVSLAASSALGQISLIATSSTSQPDPRSPTVQAVTALAAQCLERGEPVVRPERSESPTSETAAAQADAALQPHVIAVPLAALSPTLDAVPRPNAALVLEWEQAESLVAAVPVLTQVVEPLALVWQQQRRWLGLPGWLRWFLRPHPYRSRNAGKWLVAVSGVLLAVVAWRLLVLPYPLTIEAEAVLEPVTRRGIFATADGYVDTVLVDDGAQVQAGMPLVQLRSPQQSLLFEELQGQLASNQEKRNGLRIALNQLDTNTPNSAGIQGRLSSEIAQLDSQDAAVGKKLALLREESARLTIAAPINGVVMARDLRQHLSARPVRRGEALFEVADLDGAWQLRIQLPDRDSGHVVRAYLASPASHNNSASHLSPVADGTHSVPSQPGSVQLVFDSLPGERFSADVTWIAGSVENPRGHGCTLEVRAAVDPQLRERLNMGAGCRVFFQCGQHPLWWVWSRPLIEHFQRKLWLRSF
jgi:hypothetical protein